MGLVQFLFFVICFLSVTTHVFASIGARPAYVYVSLDKRNPSGTFTITNISDTKQVYRARTTHFMLNENGTALPVKPDKYSLANWIKFNPKEFTLPPKASRKIRFSIVNKHKLEPHEYWGAIEFTPLKGVIRNQKGKDGRNVGVELVTQLVIPIYGLKSGTSYHAEITDVLQYKKEKNNRLKATVHNLGEGGLRVSGAWQIYDKKTAKLVLTKPVGAFLVLPKQKRITEMLIKEALPPGEYSIMLQLKQNKPKELMFSGKGDVVF